MDELSLCTFQYMDGRGPFSNITRGGARKGFHAGLKSGQTAKLVKFRPNSIVLGSKLQHTYMRQ